MVDWNAIWKKEFQASRLSKENYYDQEARAKSYDASENIWRDGRKRAAELNPDPSWSVLDIGSGPGTLAIPLARKVKKVTAVEPSLAMIRCLKRHLAEDGLTNVTVINSRWEDVSPAQLEAHDMVIASYSLNFENIQEALLKMDRLAKRMVILYWFAGITNWESIRLDLYPQVKGHHLDLSPKCNVLYNLLYDLGLYPDLEVQRAASFPREYSEIKDALQYLKSTLNISDDDYDDVLRKYIEDHWLREDGRLFMTDKTTYVKLSWVPGESDG